MKKTDLAAKAMAVLIGALIALACSELFLRGVALYAEHRQTARNLHTAQARGSYKILCIGESTTMNQYPAYLELALNRRNIGVKFSVIDKGVASTTTGSILGKLEEHLATYSPDMVVAMIGINDQLPLTAASRSGILWRLRTIQLLHYLKELKLLPRFAFGPTPACAAEVPKTEMMYGCSIKPAADFNCLNALSSTGKTSAAAAAYKQIIAESEKDAEESCIELLILQKREKNLAGARQTLTACLRRMPTRALYKEAAELALAEERITEATTLFTKALTAQSSCCMEREVADIHTNLGRIYSQQDKLAEAERHFKKAAEADPTAYMLRFEMVNFYETHGRKQEAIAELEQILPLVPKDEESCYLTALAQLKNDKNLRRRAQELLRRHNPATAANYRAIKDMVLRRGLKFVAVQYPMRPVEQVKDMLRQDPQVIFVDNEESFKKGVQQEGYESYFIDRFGGDFGHCTMHGNLLLANNIAHAMLAQVFKTSLR